MYNLTLNEIVNLAFTELTIIAPGETVEGDDFDLAVKHLNMMFNMWQTPSFGLHLWLYDEVTLFLEPGKQYYNLGGPDSDRVSTNIRRTYLSGDANVLDTIIGLNSTSEMTVGDNIGITLNNGTIQWTTITQIVNDIVTIADELNDYALQDNAVFVYTDDIGKVFEVDNMRLLNTDGSSATCLMTKLSRREFFRILNPSMGSSPIQYFVDRRKDTCRLWLSGIGDTDINKFLQFTAKRPLSAITSPGANVDFPEEWIGPIVWNLALSLASTYEKEFKVSSPNLISSISAKAMMGLDALRDYDVEDTSVVFYPDLRDYF